MVEFSKEEQRKKLEDARVTMEADRQLQINQAEKIRLEQEMRVESYRLEQEAKHAEAIQMSEFYKIEEAHKAE